MSSKNEKEILNNLSGIASPLRPNKSDLLQNIAEVALTEQYDRYGIIVLFIKIFYLILLKAPFIL